MSDTDKTTSILPSKNPDLPPDTPWYAILFITGLRDAWKLLSVNLPIIAAAAVEVDQASGGQIMALFPDTWKPHIAAAGLVCVALLRLVNQSKGNGK